MSDEDRSRALSAFLFIFLWDTIMTRRPSHANCFSVRKSVITKLCGRHFSDGRQRIENLQRSVRRDSENVSQLCFDFHRRVPCNFNRGVERSISCAEEKSLRVSLRA